MHLLRSYLALSFAALVSITGCGDDHGTNQPLDSGMVIRLDGELPDIPRPLDAFTSLDLAMGADATTPLPPPAIDASTDAGIAADAGATRPDVGPEGDAGPTCAELAARYAVELASAQVCVVDSDCAELVCDGPCCNCRLYVRSGTAAALGDVLADFGESGCLSMLACPDFVCPEPTGATCYRGACMTSREH